MVPRNRLIPSTLLWTRIYLSYHNNDNLGITKSCRSSVSARQYGEGDVAPLARATPVPTSILRHPLVVRWPSLVYLPLFYRHFFASASPERLLNEQLVAPVPRVEGLVIRHSLCAAKTTANRAATVECSVETIRHEPAHSSSVFFADDKA